MWSMRERPVVYLDPVLLFKSKHIVFTELVRTDMKGYLFLLADFYDIRFIQVGMKDYRSLLEKEGLDYLPYVIVSLLEFSQIARALSTVPTYLVVKEQDKAIAGIHYVKNFSEFERLAERRFNE